MFHAVFGFRVIETGHDDLYYSHSYSNWAFPSLTVEKFDLTYPSDDIYI